MEFQFAQIKSRFSYKLKVLLLILAFLLFFFIIPIILIWLSLPINVLIVSVFLNVILFFLFIKKLIDDHEIIGNIIFYDSHLYISCIDCSVGYKSIKHINIAKASVSGGKSLKTLNSYYIQVVNDDKKHEYLEITRNQFVNYEFKKSYIWNSYKDLFEVINFLGIEYKIKRNCKT